MQLLKGGVTSKILLKGFILVKYLRGFLPVVSFGNLLFIHASTNATDDQKYSLFPTQILTVPKFWYHLANLFPSKNVLLTLLERDF